MNQSTCEAMKTEDPQQRLDRWLTKHRGLLLKVVLSFTRNGSDQDDLLQEIAIALWKSMPGFRGESGESTWVYKVALFTATTWSRGEDRRRERVAMESRGTLEHESRCAGDPRQEWMLETIRGLPVVDRTLVLSSLEGYSHAEIAELTGLSTTNVGVRLHRLKKQLAKLATEHFDDV
ncbi:MAG: sigma-70 family RNA polymerase sigma factor [Planctomycetota bacterium]